MRRVTQLDGDHVELTPQMVIEDAVTDPYTFNEEDSTAAQSINLEDNAAAAALTSQQQQLTSETVGRGEATLSPDTMPPTTVFTYDRQTSSPDKKHTVTAADISRHMDEVIRAVSKGEFPSKESSPPAETLPAKPQRGRKRQLTASSTDSVEPPAAKRLPSITQETAAAASWLDNKTLSRG